MTESLLPRGPGQAVLPATRLAPSHYVAAPVRAASLAPHLPATIDFDN